MNDINQVIKDIRPKLRHVAPQTYWATIGFGMFNTIIGVSLMNISILVHLNLLGFIPIQAWGLIFFLHGTSILLSLGLNNYKNVRRLHGIGIFIKSAWLIEITTTLFSHGTGLFLVEVWLLLLFLQINIWLNFTPKTNRSVSHG